MKSAAINRNANYDFEDKACDVALGMLFFLVAALFVVVPIAIALGLMCYGVWTANVFPIVFAALIVAADAVFVIDLYARFADWSR